VQVAPHDPGTTRTSRFAWTTTAAETLPSNADWTRGEAAGALYDRLGVELLSDIADHPPGLPCTEPTLGPKASLGRRPQHVLALWQRSSPMRVLFSCRRWLGIRR
jgi:hypothetical protein